MMRRIQTAVAASATPVAQRQLLRALTCAGIELVAIAQDGQTAWNLLKSHMPDLFVVDLELPVMDGASLARRALCSFALPVRPAVLLMHYPEFQVPDGPELAASGAVLLDKPPQEERFVEAVRQLRSAETRFRPEECARVDHLLDALGVPQHVGRACLRAAILICATDVHAIHNLTGRVYPAAGECCGCTPQQAERAMRHAINLAWQSDQVDNQYRIFADTIDAGRGQPTCGEMISRLADILRLEG